MPFKKMPVRKFPQNPEQCAQSIPFKNLKILQDPSGPLGLFMTLRTLQDLSGPFMPLQELSGPFSTFQEPSGPYKTLEDKWIGAFQCFL